MAARKNSLNVSIIILFICLVVVLRIGALQASFNVDIKKPQFAEQLGQWNFKREIPISEGALEILGTKGAGLAEYEDKQGEKLHIYILKTSGRRSSIHQPEYCYSGGNNEILSKGTMTISPAEKRKMNVNYFIVQSDTGFQVVVYFYTANELISNNYYLQQLFFLKKRLQSKPVEGSLIRVSKFSQDNEFSDDLNKLQLIAEELVRKIN